MTLELAFKALKPAIKIGLLSIPRENRIFGRPISALSKLFTCGEIAKETEIVRLGQNRESRKNRIEQLQQEIESNQKINAKHLRKFQEVFILLYHYLRSVCMCFCGMS